MPGVIASLRAIIMPAVADVSIAGGACSMAAACRALLALEWILRPVSRAASSSVAGVIIFGLAVAWEYPGRQLLCRVGARGYAWLEVMTGYGAVRRCSA